MATLATLPGGDINLGVIAKAVALGNTEVAKLAPLIVTALASVESTFISDMAASGLTFTSPTSLTNTAQISSWLAPLLQSMIQGQALSQAVSTLTTANLL